MGDAVTPRSEAFRHLVRLASHAPFASDPQSVINSVNMAKTLRRAGTPASKRSQRGPRVAARSRLACSRELRWRPHDDSPAGVKDSELPVRPAHTARARPASRRAPPDGIRDPFWSGPRERLAVEAEDEPDAQLMTDGIVDKRVGLVLRAPRAKERDDPELGTDGQVPGVTRVEGEEWPE